MPSLPDDALVVRGGVNTVELLETGTGVTVDVAGNLHGLSVNSAPGKTVAELSVGIPNRQIGVTSVRAVRKLGGEVRLDPNFHNPHHCLLEGVSANVAHALFHPTILNPSRVK